MHRIARRFCSLAVVSLIVLYSGIVDAAVDKHTVAVWLFEEGNGKTAKDASGNGHDGEFAGSPKWVKAKFGTGLELPRRCWRLRRRRFYQKTGVGNTQY